MWIQPIMLVGLGTMVVVATGMPMFEIADSVGKGKVLLATRRLLPGTRVINEHPLFVYDMKERMKVLAKGGICSVLRDMLGQFKTMKPENQTRYLSLYGPVEDMQPLIDEARRSGNFTSEDAQLAVKIFSILRLNAWSDGVYCDSSRMSHSCAPNCYISSDGERMTVYTVRPVEAGEELTISYRSEDACLEPTFQRRRRYLLTKQFTCHCPRCDAPGDDTRQFECERPGCSGFHLVRYPVDAGAPEMAGMARLLYTSVTYEEPRLLPCDTCQHPASPAFQRQQLEIERHLPTLADAVTKEAELVTKEGSTISYKRLGALLGKVKYPRRHVYSVPLLWGELCLRLYEDPDSADQQPVVDTLRDLVRLQDGVLGPYNHLSAKRRATIGGVPAPTWQSPV